MAPTPEGTLSDLGERSIERGAGRKMDVVWRLGLPLVCLLQSWLFRGADEWLPYRP